MGTNKFTLSLSPIEGKELSGFVIGIARRDADIKHVCKLGGPSVNVGYAMVCPAYAKHLETMWEEPRRRVSGLPELSKTGQTIKIIYEVTDSKQSLHVAIDDLAPVDVCFSKAKS